MNEINIFKILSLRMKTPDVLYKQQVCKNIVKLFIEYGNNKDLKKQFLVWLKSIELETEVILALWIVYVVNERLCGFFSHKEVVENITAKSILSELYLEDIFLEHNSQLVGNFSDVDVVGTGFKNSYFKEVPLEGYVKHIDGAFNGFERQWRVECRFLQDQVIEENLNSYRSSNRYNVYQISFISSSALVRTIYHAIINTGDHGFKSLVDMSMPLNLDLYKLSPSNIENLYQKTILEQKYKELFNNDFIPVWMKFAVNNNEDSIEYKFSLSVISDSEQKEKGSALFPPEITTTFTPEDIFVKTFGKLSDNLYVDPKIVSGFCQLYLSNVVIPNNRFINFSDIKVFDDKIAFFDKGTMIAFYKISYDKPDRFDKRPNQLRMSNALFISKDVIDEIKKQKSLEINLRKKEYKKVSHDTWDVGTLVSNNTFEVE